MRYLIFAGLLALQIVLSTCDEPIFIDKEVGSRLELEGPQDISGKLLNCTLENSEKKYSVYPDNDSPGEYSGYGDYCRSVIYETDLSWAGLWTMTTITDEETYTTEFKIRVSRNVRVNPSNYIDAYAGQYVTVALDTVDTDIRSCNVTFPGFAVRDIMKEQIEGVQILDGACGMRIRANKSFDGQWEFDSQIGDYLINHAMFHIKVPYESEPRDEIEVMKDTWILGQERQSVDLYNLGALFCQLTRPDGTKTPITYGNCKMEVPVASELHEGTWRVTYAKSGLMELLHKDIVIKVKDPTTLEASYSYGPHGEINLLCKTGNPIIRFCTFIRPDKYMINLPLGVGNENYSYYGNGYDNRYATDRDFGECGVTIHKPSNVDLGLWTCEMGMTAGNVQGTVINVKKLRAGEPDRADEASNPPIFVKRSDSFQINCKATAPLNYCWLTSPNGTTFTVSPGKGSRKTLEYNGKGFSMGECGAIVAKSNVTDDGEWTCHMGLNGGFEIEQKVSVKVSESYLRAETETVYAGKETKLTCRTFIADEATLRYCRWVRPNGQGINKADASRYQLSQGMDQCSLSISDVQSEDLGKWSCHSALSKFTGQEEWATVELRSKEMEEAQIVSVLSIVLGSALLVITLIGAAFAALFIYKRRNARVARNPPPYYAQEYAMPNEVRTDAEPIPEKNYKY